MHTMLLRIAYQSLMNLQRMFQAYTIISQIVRFSFRCIRELVLSTKLILRFLATVDTELSFTCRTGLLSWTQSTTEIGAALDGILTVHTFIHHCFSIIDSFSVVKLGNIRVNCHLLFTSHYSAYLG